MSSKLQGVPTLNSVQKSGNQVMTAVANTTVMEVKNPSSNTILKLENDATNNGLITISNSSGTATATLNGTGDYKFCRAGSGNLVVGAATTYASSIMNIESTTRGFLSPRMTKVQKEAISSPATGLIVYDTTLNKLCVYTGAAWETITSA